ncbi:hypothetical protein [Actomonas aquatica]|uniref:Transglutaminase-like domain-containing protein n=1 Tax=Actomonas aquatica TaxID=2866162 RepID=A0ABZ1C5F6_9BACT|nr:hypothetical protein [Opitutus sp. WL0086]WRQ86966.1 hypothetical protein K1X11_019300 [Opitutus sp. WL0086]
MSIRRNQLWACLLIFASASFGVAGRGQLDLPPPLDVDHLVSAQELLEDARQLLPSGGFVGPLLDEQYAVIDHGWLKNTFLPFYREEAAKLRAVASREGEASDCDNYGMFLRQMVGLAGIMGRTEEPAVAQVVVVQNRPFSGVRRTRENHSVGLFLTDRGWYVIEPQNGDKLIPFRRYANRKTVRYMSFH